MENEFVLYIDDEKYLIEEIMDNDNSIAFRVSEYMGYTKFAFTLKLNDDAVWEVKNDNNFIDKNLSRQMADEIEMYNL